MALAKAFIRLLFEARAFWARGRFGRKTKSKEAESGQNFLQDRVAEVSTDDSRYPLLYTGGERDRERENWTGHSNLNGIS